MMAKIKRKKGGNMKFVKPNQTPDDALQYILGNPRQGARKIIKAGYDDVSTYEMIAQARWYMAQRLAVEELAEFNDELEKFGWGKED